MKQRKPGGDRPAAADPTPANAPANAPGDGPVTSPPVDGEAEPLPEDGFDRISHGELTLPQVRALASTCRACALWERATQTVFGEGPVPARWMLVGEQPGDVEDVEGHPFVGPAGRVLADAIGEAGMERERTFVTNVVKHFKWKPTPGGKRRLHEKPSKVEVEACLPWVASELALVRPEALVLLGATAAQGLLGPKIRVTLDRGRCPSSLASLVVVTIHPSAVLRTQTREQRATRFEDLVHDLRVAVSID